jgi:uncharacterized surface protein with fasciclin (FAS1) repeats
MEKSKCTSIFNKGFKMKRLSIIIGLIFLTACSSIEPHKKASAEEATAPVVAEGTTPVTLSADDPDVGTFVKLATAAKLMHIFEGTGPFTAFVPSNAAFAKLGNDKLNRLMQPQGRDEATVLILSHIVPGRYTGANLKTRELTTLSGKKLSITADDGQVTVNGAKVIKPDDKSGPNGVVHVIDAVIVSQN